MQEAAVTKSRKLSDVYRTASLVPRKERILAANWHDEYFLGCLWFPDISQKCFFMKKAYRDKQWGAGP